MRREKGFTFVEYVLVVALAGMIFLALAQIVVITIRSWDIAMSGASMIDLTDVNFSRMAREIRQMRDRTSLVTAYSNRIRFYDVNNNDITYRLYDGALERNGTECIDEVDSLTFQYLDKNGAVISSPIVSPSNTNVRMVRITMTVSPTSQSMTVQTLVRLRDIL